MKLELNIPEHYVGMPAGPFLKKVLGFSPFQCKKIRLYGRLSVNGELQRMKDALPSGHMVIEDRDYCEGKTPLLKSSGDPYRVYRDAWIVVGNKPGGMLTHPNVEDPNPAMTEILADPPLRPVQRLDRDTSGLLLFAMHAHAQYRLSQQKMRRRYLAFIYGIPTENQGTINEAIGRNPGSIVERRIASHGKKAISHYRCLKRWPKAGVSLLQLDLETGRTHQLRLHCLSQGWPLVGETLYTWEREELAGRKVEKPKHIFELPRQALHASQLGFIHPDALNPRAMFFTAPLPEDLQQFYVQLQTEWT